MYTYEDRKYLPQVDDLWTAVVEVVDVTPTGVTCCFVDEEGAPCEPLFDLPIAVVEKMKVSLVSTGGR